jgi:hypothetical protein
MQFKVCEISHRQQKSGSLQTNFTHPSQKPLRGCEKTQVFSGNHPPVFTR